MPDFPNSLSTLSEPTNSTRQKVFSTCIRASLAPANAYAVPSGIAKEFLNKLVRFAVSVSAKTFMPQQLTYAQSVGEYFSHQAGGPQVRPDFVPVRVYPSCPFTRSDYSGVCFGWPGCRRTLRTHPCAAFGRDLAMREAGKGA